MMRRTSREGFRSAFRKNMEGSIAENIAPSPFEGRGLGEGLPLYLRILSKVSKDRGFHFR